MRVPIYNEFKNVMVQNLQAQKLLPVDPEVVSAERKTGKSRLPVMPGRKLSSHGAGARGGELLVDYIYEQPVEEIFRALVPRYLETEIYRILLESAAAEHAARMTAMDAATRNASN